MRHRKKTLKFNRTSAHRKALLHNLVSSLIREERIVTTVARAKAVSPLADRMVTLAKADSIAARRRAFRVLGDRTLVKKLFGEIGPRFEGREGGYTRVLKMASFRRGDGSPRALLAFTEEGEKTKPPSTSKKEKKKPKT